MRAQLKQARGGADVVLDQKGNRIGGARLIAVVTLDEKNGTRAFRTADARDYEAILGAQRAVERLSRPAQGGELKEIPDEPLSRVPVPFGVINVWVYGVATWGDLFTARQKLVLATINRLIRNLETNDEPVRDLLRCAHSIFARACNANARVRPDASVAPAFGMQALPFTWTFPETVPFGHRSENFTGAISAVRTVVENPAVRLNKVGQWQQVDAAKTPLPDACAEIWFTDPPYYDAIPYSYLSDFFYVWLKRSAGPASRSVFLSELTPKANEIVRYLTEDLQNEDPSSRFERMLTAAFGEGRRVLKADGIGSIVFAHKTTEGWEALLSGIIKQRWVVVASWPLATESGNRLRARDSAALATSIHLVCRPRADDTSIGDWGDVLRELPNRIADWMERLSSEGVRGADLVFACIGPAMEVYSRYRKVEDAEGREIPLGGDPEAVEPYKRGFLAYVWETVGRIALEQILGTAEARARNGAAGALEEDARLTALFLWTIQSTATNGADAESDKGESEDDDEEAGAGKSKKGLTLVYDVARRFAQPLGIHMDRWKDRIIVTEKGIVRLLPVIERAEQLLGEDGAIGAADLIERTKGKNINYEFAFASEVEERPPKPKPKTRKGGAGRDEAPAPKQGTTTLDHVHIAMLLQKSGKSNALRTMLKSEIERGPDFLRLANALSALYPKESEEKRLLDAMLLAAPR